MSANDILFVREKDKKFVITMNDADTGDVMMSDFPKFDNLIECIKYANEYADGKHRDDLNDFYPVEYGVRVIL